MGNKKVRQRGKTREALFELQVEAFLEGVSDEEPQAAEHDLTEERAQEIIRDATRWHLATSRPH
jgi:hypothetical protein